MTAQPDNTSDGLTEIFSLFDKSRPDFLEAQEQRVREWAAQEANKARETDEYGNPMVQLNMYEAKAVASLLDELANSDYRRLYDTGDWFLDVPRKIAQRLQALTADKEQNNE